MIIGKNNIIFSGFDIYKKLYIPKISKWLYTDPLVVLLSTLLFVVIVVILCACLCNYINTILMFVVFVLGIGACSILYHYIWLYMQSKHCTLYNNTLSGYMTEVKYFFNKTSIYDIVHNINNIRVFPMLFVNRFYIDYSHSYRYYRYGNIISKDIFTEVKIPKKIEDCSILIHLKNNRICFIDIACGSIQTLDNMYNYIISRNPWLDIRKCSYNNSIYVYNNYTHNPNTNDICSTLIDKLINSPDLGQDLFFKYSNTPYIENANLPYIICTDTNNYITELLYKSDKKITEFVNLLTSNGWVLSEYVNSACVKMLRKSDTICMLSTYSNKTQVRFCKITK